MRGLGEERGVKYSRYAIRYPRRRVFRGMLRGAARLLLRSLCRVEIEGRGRFPEGGPLIVVGNHAAVMETVMMTVFTPWQMELMGAADIPHERISQVVMDLYRVIPVRRGAIDREAMFGALSVLEQGGIIGAFPEGGIWQAGQMAPRTGVAWLSERSGAPVLPIGFGGMWGALGKALRFERPRLTMRVGEALPAAKVPAGMSRKKALEAYARQVLAAIRELVPEAERAADGWRDAWFELVIEVRDADEGEWRSALEAWEIPQGAALAQLLQTPGLMKVFVENLGLPCGALMRLGERPSNVALKMGCEAVLGYLEDENPFFLDYRVGGQLGRDMRLGLEQLSERCVSADAQGVQLGLAAVRHGIDLMTGEAVAQTEQGAWRDWM